MIASVEGDESFLVRAQSFCLIGSLVGVVWDIIRIILRRFRIVPICC